MAEITIRDILDAYSKHMETMGRKLSSYTIIGSVDLILPFFIGDIILTIYNKQIAPMKCSFEQQRYKKQWKENYNKFNRPFFRSFNEEQTDAVLDLMDEYEEYVGNYVEMLRISLLPSCPDLPDDKKAVVSWIMTANMLAQQAATYWENIYQEPARPAQVLHTSFYRWKNSPDPNLQAMCKDILHFLIAYCPEIKTTKTMSFDRVEKAFDALSQKTLNYLYKKRDEQRQIA